MPDDRCQLTARSIQRVLTALPRSFARCRALHRCPPFRCGKPWFAGGSQHWSMWRSAPTGCRRCSTARCSIRTATCAWRGWTTYWWRMHRSMSSPAMDPELGRSCTWSHLLDTLLLVLAVPLAPFLGEHEALRWAGVLLGPLSAGLLGMALGLGRGTPERAGAAMDRRAERFTRHTGNCVLAARCRASPHACRALGGDVRWLGGTFRVRRSPRRQKAGRLGMLRVVAEPRSDADRAHVTWRRRSRLAAAP